MILWEPVDKKELSLSLPFPDNSILEYDMFVDRNTVKRRKTMANLYEFKEYTGYLVKRSPALDSNISRLTYPSETNASFSKIILMQLVNRHYLDIYN